jgi:hypothetical protein
VSLEKEKGEWFVKILGQLAVTEKKPLTFIQLKTDFEIYFDDFELFWYSKPIYKLRESGLLAL